MALPMVHLAAAYKWVADKPDLLNCPQYYLGAISPDAIHSRPDIVRNDKKKTHDITNQYIRQNLNDSFYIGYLVHILTDRIWVQYYIDNCPGLFDDNGKTVPSLYYNDADQVDYILYERLPYREYMFDMLKQSITIEVNGLLTNSEIEAWKQRTLHWFENESQWKNPIQHLTYEVVSHFIDTVSVKLDEAFNQYENFVYQ